MAELLDWLCANLDVLGSVVSSLLVIAAIRQRVVRAGGFGGFLKNFTKRIQGGEDLILASLVIPELLKALYYALHLVVPGFGQDPNRLTLIRSAIITGDVILTIYFLNGQLVERVRAVVSWLDCYGTYAYYKLWNRR